MLVIDEYSKQICDEFVRKNLMHSTIADELKRLEEEIGRKTAWLLCNAQSTPGNGEFTPNAEEVRQLRILRSKMIRNAHKITNQVQKGIDRLAKERRIIADQITHFENQN
jgi:hypothetical protein